MTLPLLLRHGAEPQSAPAAWFLPGDSAERWLDELAQSGLGDNETRLFLVPRSVEDRACAGLLAVPARADSVSRPPAGLACRLIAGRLFAPVDAVLYPPVTDTEVRALCPLPVYFYHPAFGLSGFEEESALRASDLLQAPAVLSGDWNSARGGPPAPPELAALVIQEPPSLEDAFGDAQEEIGSKPPADLPPAPGEPREDMISKTKRNLRQIFLKGAAGALRKFPHTGSRRTWVNDAEDWANRGLRGVDEQLLQLRNKEIHRLLHLLDSDPEAGLRHAIPMSSFAHRGAAPPGSRLGPRPLEFDPRRIGGGPVDFWNVPGNVQEILRRRYREMADREMQLGRHRRAAYIYAELLGDLASAANAFKQGRMFREAALLHDERLHNPLEAARCLADGGFLDEAIGRYEKLGRWLEVADLQRRAGNLAAAETALRRVVNERLSQGDILGAAKLVEEQLRAPEEALELLLRAWPGSPQAASCVSATFQILGRLGRHEVAREQIARFGREPVPDALALPLIAALGGVALNYPHEPARRRAADLSRVLVARQLKRPAISADETGRLLERLVRLAPRDRLLSRDANRYLADRRNNELRARRIAPPPAPGNKPSAHRRFELPRQMQWLEMRSEWHWFYALGVTANRLTLVRGVWEGEYQSVSWECPAASATHGLVFEPTRERGKAVAIARAGGAPLDPKRFPSADRFFNVECLAAKPSWLTTHGYPVAIGEDAVWSAHLANGRAILSCHDKVRGQLRRTIDVTADLLANAERGKETRVSMTALATGVAIALGNRLILTRGDGKLERVDLPGQAVRIFATLPNTRQGVAVMLQHGAVMYWTGVESCVELDRDLPSPIGAFVPGGPLVLISGNLCAVLELDSRGVKNVARMALTGQRPVGVSATSNFGEFAILGERGEMTVYRMPR